jgi:hypothetical protein
VIDAANAEVASSTARVTMAAAYQKVLEKLVEDFCESWKQ